MSVCLVGFMRAHVFENVLQVVRDEVETHEEEEDGHGEPGEDFEALEAEGVPDGGAGPDFEVAEDVDDDAEHGAEGVEEDQVRERGEGEGSLGGPKGVGCYEGVGDGPVEALGLVGGHGAAAFFEGGDGEGVGDLGGRSGGRFEEELVGYA